MRITRKQVKVDPETFAPVLEVTVQFPIHLLQKENLNEEKEYLEFAKALVWRIQKAPVSE